MRHSTGLLVRLCNLKQACQCRMHLLELKKQQLMEPKLVLGALPSLVFVKFM